MLVASCQPTTWREKTSITKLKKTTPSQVRRWVKSATQRALGRSAVKSRSTRSGFRFPAGSGVVVRQGLPRRLAPWIPFAAISRSTVQRATLSPRRSSSFQTRLEP